MYTLSKNAFQQMDAWIHENARPLDVAKWDHLFHGGTKDAIVTELCRYQNADGGMGHGLEADIQCPDSSAIATAEAIFQVYDYALDTDTPWFRRMLDYLEATVQPIAKYWEDTPPTVMEHPHAPWWNYSAPDDHFTPNPCGCIASALLRYGTDSQKALGERVAKDCLALLTGNDFCGDHDTLNEKALVESLMAIGQPLATEAVVASLRRRIRENTSFDTAQWQEYVFQPLDFVDRPTSLWYPLFADHIDDNIGYWLDTRNDVGVWEPNFTWGEDSAVARAVTMQWRGYITLKRTRILQNFGRIEP